MSHRRTGHRGGHHQIGRQRGQGGVGTVQCGVGPVHEGTVTGCAHAVHLDIAQSAQLSHQFSDVDTGTAVDLGWVLPRHHCHPRRG